MQSQELISSMCAQFPGDVEFSRDCVSRYFAQICFIKINLVHKNYQRNISEKPENLAETIAYRYGNNPNIGDDQKK